MAKIIIIDDNPYIRNILSRILKSKGHNVVVASDGLNAIALIRNNLPDLVILDRKLPFASGDEVFKKIREISKAIKIIILTGYDDVPKDYFIEEGAIDYISKSEGMSKIIKKIERNISFDTQTLNKTFTNSSVLIVDDESYIRELIKRILTPEYNIFEASNGKEALKIIKNNDISLVLLDIFMPEIDGKEFILELKRQNYHIPVVVISGNENEDIAREFLKLGAVDYIKKPLNIENLKMLVRILTI